MNFLTIDECNTFIFFFYSKIEKEGLIDILSSYQNNNKNISLAIKSFYDNLVQGLSIKNSIEKMIIKFPPSIETILIKGFENSILDYALKDIKAILELNLLEELKLEKLSRLVDKYNDNIDSEIICEGCFITELEKIFKRIEIEKAFKVIFEQDKEDFLIQKYLGIKMIKYIEPTHSKTYKTILKKLNLLSNKKENLVLLNKYFFVTKENNNNFLIFNDNYQVIFSFT
ncbi:MAG: hypothetical protein U0457_02085 [Candidatus Sericytochromatia bacterium]